jgi:hypothetical protein
LERASADFEGASEDGSRVYFAAPLAKGQHGLVPGAEDASRNLYLATIGCPQATPGCAVGERVVSSLVEASHDPNGGQAADVMGTVRVAPDGSRAYFVAGGNLLTVAQREALEREGAPVPQVGAANLYVFEAATGSTPASTRFIADLCSGANASGSVEDARCPSESDERMWTHIGAGTLAQTADANGSFLVFESNGQLTSSDTNHVRDVYRYDAFSGRLNRVSLGEGGFDDNGNRAVFGPSGEPLGAQIDIGEKVNNGSSVMAQHGLVTRAISEDGTRIVFGSAEPLSPVATNGLENAYEWRESAGGEGIVSIVSSGDSEAAVPVERLVISPSGRDVFFATTQSLLAQDTDVLYDVYDAREGEGFPVAPAPLQTCSGDACQGPLTSPEPVLVPASVVQQPGGNYAVKPATGKIVKKQRGCRAGLVKKKGRCVKRKAARKGTKSSGRRGK